MTDLVPASHRDLLDRPIFASLAVATPSGRVAVNPVWFHFKEGHLWFNSARGRLKDRWIRENPQVALCLLDPDNGYRYLELRGRVVETTEEGADQHIDDLAERYLGQRPYPFRQPGEVRVSYKVELLACKTMG